MLKFKIHFIKYIDQLAKIQSFVHVNIQHGRVVSAIRSKSKRILSESLERQEFCKSVLSFRC